MKQSRAMEIAESFINGNISWTREELSGRTKLTVDVTRLIAFYWPKEFESFIRLVVNYNG